jgi:hypothetical protein
MGVLRMGVLRMDVLGLDVSLGSGLLNEPAVYSIFSISPSASNL